MKKLPSYEEIKQLDDKFMHSIQVFHLFGSGYLKITIRDDGDTIALDYLEKGFLQDLFYIPKEYEYIKLNKLYKLNKKNYNLILKQIKYIQKRILEEVHEQLE